MVWISQTEHKITNGLNSGITEEVAENNTCDKTLVNSTTQVQEGVSQHFFNKISYCPIMCS